MYRLLWSKYRNRKTLETYCSFYAVYRWKLIFVLVIFLIKASPAYIIPVIAADIISLVRCYAVHAELLDHEERIRRAVARLKQAHTFSRAEEKWIDRMEKYLLNESVLSVRTFDESPAFRERGGFAALDRLFQHRLESLVHELNGYLYDDGGLAA